jgi:hypothetical protein
MIATTTYHVATCDTCKRKFDYAPALVVDLVAGLRAKKWQHLEPYLFCPECWDKYLLIMRVVDISEEMLEALVSDKEVSQ